MTWDTGHTDRGSGPVLRRVFLRDMVLLASIGVERREHRRPQRIRINVDLEVPEDGQGVGEDRLERVVDYAEVARQVRAVVADGHVRLAETLAERIAAACLRDKRVTRVRVQVEKLDVFQDMASAGVAVERCQPSTPTV